MATGARMVSSAVKFMPSRLLQVSASRGARLFHTAPACLHSSHGGADGGSKPTKSIVTPDMLNVAAQWPKDYYDPTGLNEEGDHSHGEGKSIQLIDASGEGSVRPSHLYGAGLPLLLGIGLLAYGLASVSAALSPASVSEGTDASSLDNASPAHPFTRAIAGWITTLNSKSDMYTQNDALMAHAQRVANDRIILMQEGAGLGNRMSTLFTPITVQDVRRSPIPSEFYRASDLLVEPGSQFPIANEDPYTKL